MSELAFELARYHKYHKNKTNQMIHIFGIPAIVWSMLVLLSSSWIYHPLFLFYSMYYVHLDEKLGMITDTGLLGLHFYARYFSQNVTNASYYAILVQALAWIGQFIGHGIYEKNKPALMDSLVQAFLMAPIFVTAEVSFLLGYSKELQKEMLDYEQHM